MKEMRELKVTRTSRMQRCNVCDATNYDSKITSTKKTVDYLNEIQIGNMVNILCDKCCEKLKQNLIDTIKR